MTNSEIENTCPYCTTPMRASRMTCPSCDISVEADFADRPLTRLPVEHQRFIEMFVLAGGSLKEIATQAGVSYPTVRSRLDKVIEYLRLELEADKRTSKGRKKSADTKSAAEILKQI